MRIQGFRATPGLHNELLKLDCGTVDDVDGLIKYAYKDIPNRLHPCLVESNVTTIEEPDFLDMVSKIRECVDIGKSKSVSTSLNIEQTCFYIGKHIPMHQPPCGLKKYDTPDMKYGPVLTTEETFLWLIGESTKEKSAKRMLEELKIQYPLIMNCEDKKHRGCFYVDLVMDYKEHNAGL